MTMVIRITTLLLVLLVSMNKIHDINDERNNKHNNKLTEAFILMKPVKLYNKNRYIYNNI